MSRFLYQNSLNNFLNENLNSILGKIIKEYQGVINDETRYSWEEEINILKIL